MAQQLINGKQQFIDGNGNPLAGGSVAFYQPGTLTPVNTYQDPGLTTPNANPVVLDANGMGTIWGALETQYRQVVTNALGVQLWDQVVGTIGTAATQSVQSGSYNTASDTGSANAYAMTLSPAPAALTPGMVVTLQNIQSTNTGPSTLNVNGLGALSILDKDNNELKAGALATGGIAVLTRTAAQAAWILMASTRATVPSSLLNIQYFTTSGTYTPTPGTRIAKVKLWGAGASGIGAASGWSTGGQGGPAGAYVEGMVANPVATTITIGAGGAQSVGGAPINSGGTSSFGSIMVAPGGGSADTVVGGSFSWSVGATTVGSSAMGGSGSQSYLSSYAPPSPGAGLNGAFPGGGAGGGAPGSGGFPSGVGANGFCIVEEFA